MATTEFGSAEICIVRATPIVDCCPRPDLTPDGLGIVTKCVAEISSEPNVTSEEPIEPDIGCGTKACWRIEQCDEEDYEVITTLRFGSWNPQLSSTLTGDTVYHNADGDQIGVGRKGGQKCQTWALEVWAQAGKADPNCAPSTGCNWTYYAWPNIKGGTRSGVTLSGRGIHYFTVSGANAYPTKCWNPGGVAATGPLMGPYNDFPSVDGYNPEDISVGPILWCNAPVPVPTFATLGA
jgi:hypothetical protein